MAYGLHDLELTGLQVKTILSAHIFHRPGEHGVLELEADLGEENGDFPIHETESCQKITLYGKRNGKKETLFCGVIVKLEVSSTGKSHLVKMTAYTSSYLMDIKRKSRSFQDTSMSMGTLIRQIVREYGGEYQILFSDKAIGEIAVQYDETDWQFLKRILSAWNIPVVCSEVRSDVCLYFGAAQIPARIQLLSVEKAGKDMEEMAYWKEAGARVKDEEFILYQLKLDNHVVLYAEVAFRQRNLTVAELEYRTIGSTMYEFVTLRKKSGIRQKTIYPMELVGSALEGTIVNVKGEKVQIHLKIDDAYPGKDCYWFPFSTPSASSDGSGWYCMPEKGDQVRVYFPTKKTGEVIAVSAVSTYDPSPKKQSSGSFGSSSNSGGSSGSGGASGGSSGGGGSSASGASSSGGSGLAVGAGAALAADQTGTGAEAGKKGAGKDKMSDPATKYLRTSSGQEIKLGPKGIEVICSGGAVKLEILKSGRINIYASDSVNISAQRNINLKAKNLLKVQCKEAAYLASQMGGSLYLSDEGKLVIQGTEVRMN